MLFRSQKKDAQEVINAWRSPGENPQRITKYTLTSGEVAQPLRLEYYGPEGQKKEIACGPYLAQFKGECARLSYDVGWPQAEIVDWVLCGNIPETALWMKWRLSTFGPPSSSVLVFSISGDARSLANEVADFFSQQKKKIAEIAKREKGLF